MGQWILVASSLVLLAAVDVQLNSVPFGIGMFFAGAGLGLLASQLGNVNMSSVTGTETSEVGGLQGVAQNLGSSLGTALIGSVLIAALATSFAGGVASSDLPAERPKLRSPNSPRAGSRSSRRRPSSSWPRMRASARATASS